MLVKCEKCKYEFETELKGCVFCPKCGSRAEQKMLDRKETEREVKRINRVMDGYRRVVSITINRTTGFSFRKDIRSMSFVDAFAYDDCKNIVKLRFDFASIFINEEHNGDEKDITDVRCRELGYDLFGGSPGENSLEIELSESVKMSDEDIVRYVNRMFSTSA